MRYQFARRNFLRGIGAAAGLQTLLRSLEANAQGVVRPARLIVVHRPLGTVKWAFTPSSGSMTGSRVLLPFVNQQLSSDAIVLSGVSTAHLRLTGGGAHEGGTVALMTGLDAGGTRANCCEGDDAFAVGPSFDQLFVQRSSELGTRSVHSLQVGCDARTDFGEVSTRCLSYATAKQTVLRYAGGTALENLPLKPWLSPLSLYISLFSNFMPGGATAQNVEALARAREGKQSVLDFMLSDLRRLESLAPSNQKSVMDAQLAAIREIERTLDASVASACVKPAAPSSESGKSSPPNGEGAHYSPAGWIGTDDAALVSRVARNHWAVIKAAFICDLTRVVTFQLEPGTGHVGFKLFPDDSVKAYRHHPVSHAQFDTSTLDASSPPASVPAPVEFLIRVEEWYNTLVAELLADFKASTDSFGNNLLGTTVVPYVTEVRNAVHPRDAMPAILFGGRDLGMRSNQFVTGSFTINAVWGTIAQAFGLTASAPLASPIPNLWAPVPP